LRILSLLSALLLAEVLAASAPCFAAAGAKVRRNVEVEWEGVEDASLYEVRVVRKDDRSKKAQTFKLKESKWSANINPGIYLMEIRSYDQRGVPGEWSPPSEMEVKLPAIIVKSPQPGQEIEAKNADKDKLNLEWEPVPGADHYHVTAKSTTSDWKDERDFPGTAAEMNTPVGQNIEWNVAAVDPKGTAGEVSEKPYQVEFKGPALEKPEIEKPRSKYVREVEWKAPPYAAKYNYDLSYYNAKKKKWEQVESKQGIDETKVKLDVGRPSGKYRLAVQAQAEHRKVSPKVQMDFFARGNFRDPAAFDKAILRDSLQKPTDFYAIASYLITSMNYAAKDYDANSTPRPFAALGGTGRIGLGYQSVEDNWGGFAIGDLSGFVIHGQSFKFASVEGHITRKLELGQNGILLAGTGLFAKELPLISGSAVDGYSSTDKVRTIGPHAGFTYWFPFNERWGLQANARAYYTLMGSSSSGKSAKSSLSYQYGLLGSYRMSRVWMGYAGYAYRVDDARYATNPDPHVSFAQPGQINEIKIDGHYLNLIMEFSF
jgi:hypothetical protein